MSCVVAGMITAPSFIAPSISSQSGSVLGSMTRMRSPFATPRPWSQLAMRVLRSESSAKVAETSRGFSPPSWTMRSAVRVFPRAYSSNQSMAQLKCGSRGQRNSAMAAS